MDRACYIIAYNTSKHSVKFLISKLPSRQLEKYSVRIFFAWRGLPSDNFFALPTSTARENERFCAYGSRLALRTFLHRCLGEGSKDLFTLEKRVEKDVFMVQIGGTGTFVFKDI